MWWYFFDVVGIISVFYQLIPFRFFFVIIVSQVRFFVDGVILNVLFQLGLAQITYFQKIVDAFLRMDFVLVH